MRGLILLCPMVLQAATMQSPPPADDHELVRQLLARVQQLEAEVRELKAQRPVMPAASVEAPPVPSGAQGGAHAGGAITERPAGAAQMAGMQAALQQGEYPNLRFQGFSDVAYRATDASGEHSSFAVGQFNLFITSSLSSRLSVVAEPVLEANERNVFSFELERLLVQVAASPYLSVSAGRYHTAIGWYNTAYHHSSWLQTAVERPFLFAFEDEGGILPIHNVGVSASGRIPSGPLRLRYVAEVGNGRASRTRLDEPTQNVSDENGWKALNFALFSRPDELGGFQAGASVYYDRLIPAGRSEMGQTIFAGHAVYQGGAFEWLNEAVLIRNSVRDTGHTFHTTGFYSQVAGQFGVVKPYFRYQYVDAPEEDPYFSDVGRMYGPSIGVRYDFSQLAAFKLQYDRTDRRGATGVNGLTTQVSFAF